MKILYDKHSLRQILAENPEKKIGKFSLERVIFERRKMFHPGHKSYVKTLRDAGCDIVILEVLDLDPILQKLNLVYPLNNFEEKSNQLYKFANQNKDLSKTVISARDYLKVDYLIIYRQDFYDEIEFKKEDVELNISRLEEENYKENFHLSNNQFEFLEWTALSYCATLDNKLVFTLPFVYCLPQSPPYMHVYPEKDFREKFYNNEVLLSPWGVDKNKIPWTLSFRNLMKWSLSRNEGIKEFANYVHNANYKTLSNKYYLSTVAKKYKGRITFYENIKGTAIFMQFTNKNNISIVFHFPHVV